MIKLNVFFRLKNGQIVEVQDKVDVKDSISGRQIFDIFTHKVIEIAEQSIFVDAEIIASSFGPLNM